MMGVIALVLALGMLPQIVAQGPASASAPPTGNRPACNTLLVAGGNWLGGHGVNVYSNAPDGVPCREYMQTNADQYGWGRQCVELAQRLYNVIGWRGGVFSGVNYAYQIYDNAGASGFQAYPNGGGYVPVPGDMIIEAPTRYNVAGHVAVVDRVAGGQIFTVEQNASNDGWHVYELSGSSISGGYGGVKGTVHSPNNPFTNASKADPPAFTSASASTSGAASISLAWSTPDGHGAGIQWYDVKDNQGHAWGMIRANSVTLNGGNGIALGTSYQFWVRAYNGYGTSSEGVGGVSEWSSPTAVLTPGQPPGPPTGVQAVASDGQATVSWVAPSSTGGLPITSYLVTSSPGARTCTSAGRSCVVAGLTDGTSYTFTVAALNAAGTSLPSSPTTSVTPVGVPSAPLSPAAVAGDGTVSVTWSPSATSNGSPITGYHVISAPEGKTCDVQVANPEVDACTVTGLTNGTSYKFTVTASNSLGSSRGADTPSVVPARAPDAPSGVRAAAGDRAASVTWVAPSDGGAAIGTYVVTSMPEGATCSSASTSCVVKGLHRSIAYTFTVTAANRIGVSAASSPSSAVTIGTPSAPGGVMAASAPESLTVWWQPASANGYVVSGYTATAMPGGKTCTTTGLSCVISGLTDGTGYTVTVVARNAKGTSPSSDSSAEAKPAGLPSAPTAVVGRSGDGQAVVTWSAPAIGGDSIDAYLVRASPGNATCWWSQGPLQCAVAGLQNGTRYTFKVVAFNGVGESPASSASPTLLVGLPGVPVAVSASARNAAAVVSWSAALDGGPTPTAYVVSASPGGKTCTPTPASALSCTVSGLSNGTPYTFTVAAHNAFGDSAPSTPSAAVTPVDVPLAPSGVSAAPGKAAVAVSWTAPPGATGSYAYTVTSNPDARTCSATGVTTCTVSGLRNGTPYTFTVVASNAAGAGASSAPTSPVTPADVPAAPTGVTVRTGDGTATVSWTTAVANGVPVTGYQVSGSPGGSCVPSPALAVSCVVTGLTNGTSYTFSVTATSSLGSSPPGVAAAAIPSGLPSTPGNLRQTDRSVDAIRVNWNDSTANGSPIDSYAVQVVGTAKGCSGTPGQGTCVIGGLVSWTTYPIQIRSHNANGWSPWSETVTGQTGYYVHHVGPVLGGIVRLRSGPSTGTAIVGQVSQGQEIDIVCQTPGETISGGGNSNSWWDLLTNGAYMSDFFADTSGTGGPATTGIRAC